eukprot:7723818-Alexandrium_andersonii.AAC.1
MASRTLTCVPMLLRASPNERMSAFVMADLASPVHVIACSRETCQGPQSSPRTMAAQRGVGASWSSLNGIGTGPAPQR